MAHPHAPHGVPEQVEPDLEEGESLVAATEADHRSTGDAVLGFIFSGLISNVSEKAEQEHGDADDTNHLPFGPIVAAVTDKRLLFYSRDLNLENGPMKFIEAIDSDKLKGARHGRDPLTDTMLIQFSDDTELVLNLDTINHSGQVIKGIRKLVDPAATDEPDDQPSGP